MEVRELMTKHVISISPDETASLAARLLGRHNLGALPVVTQEGRLRGMVTDRDLAIRCIAAENDPASTKIKEVMTRGVVAVTPSDDIREASRLMAAEQVRRLPVIEHGRVVGMLSLGDLARTEGFSMETAGTLSDISSGIRRGSNRY